MGFGRFGVLTERLRPLRNAAACCKSTRSSAPEPVALGSQASRLLGSRSRSECGLELAAGGLRDGNYAQFPTPARELRPAPSPETPIPLESRVLGLRSAHLTAPGRDRKSTRLNSSHGYISYAVFCLKKK